MSSMQYIDIAQLVSSAMDCSGCDSSLIGEIDGHSTIALDLYSLPCIYISVTDNDVWIWSQLGADSMIVFKQRAYEICQAVMRGCQFSRGGQLQLSEQDGELTLKMLVHTNYLSDGEKFLNALNGFYGYLDYFSGSLMK